jgi:hypothetical protein
MLAIIIRARAAVGLCEKKHEMKTVRDKDGLYMIRSQIDASFLCKEDDGRAADDKAQNHAIIWPSSNCVYAVRLAGAIRSNKPLQRAVGVLLLQ